MGDSKSNMTPTTTISKGVFSRFASRKKDDTKSPPKDDYENFADHIANAHLILGRLISAKQSDLKNEKGEEIPNAFKTTLLIESNRDLETIMDRCGEYAGL